MTHPNRQLVIAALKSIVGSKGWKNHYNPNDLRDAISYLFSKDSFDKVSQDIHLKGYRKVSNLKELDPNGLFYSFDAKPKGWGTKLPREEFIAEIEEDAQRPGFFDWAEETYQKGALAPLITINGQIGDGLGRALYFHATGRDVVVAEFETDHELDGDQLKL